MGEEEQGFCFPQTINPFSSSNKENKAKVKAEHEDHPHSCNFSVIEDPLTGETYEKGRLLGKGGFALVYEVLSTGSKSQFADKVIKKSVILKKKTTLEKVRREIAIHQQMNHVNVVQFHKHFEDLHHIHIVMEYCAKKSLLHVMKYQKRFTEAATRGYLNQICLGVQYIHSVGILHRDLKLGNMFLTDNDVVKIGDFGLATHVDDVTSSTLCGTPNYIAPEVLLKKDHGVEADIWAMGCMTYAMLVGKPPFETSSLDSTYNKIATNDFTLPEFMSDSARSFICQLLDPEPKRRGNLNPLPNGSNLLNHTFLTTDLSRKRDDRRVPFKPLVQPNGRVCNPAHVIQALIGKISKSLQSDKMQQPSSPIDIRTAHFRGPIVSKWIDYSNKYGFGYELSNKSIGILFNDGNSVVKNPVDDAYLVRSNSTANDNQETNMTHQSNGHHRPQNKDFTEYVKLLHHFSRYMEDNLADGTNHASSSSSHSKDHHTHLLKWTRSKSSVVMVLSNHAIQINFLTTHEKIHFSLGDKDVVVSIPSLERETGIPAYYLSTLPKVFNDLLFQCQTQLMLLT